MYIRFYARDNGRNTEKGDYKVYKLDIDENGL